MKSKFPALTAALVLTSAASAAPVFFLLGDHPDGQLYKANPGPNTAYGLRLDDQGGTYSVGSNLGGFGGELFLTYDLDNLAAGARIFGEIDRNSDIGEGRNYLVEYELSGLSAFGDGFRATGGMGEGIEQGVCPDICQVLSLIGKQDDDGWAFIWNNDGHRMGPNSSAWVGNGWVEGQGTNDWLVTGIPTPPPPGEEVPEPATVTLMLLGLGALVARRKFGKQV